MSIHLVQQRVTSVAFASGVLAVLERGHVDDVVRGASEGGKERARSERERRVGGDGGVGGVVSYVRTRASTQVPAST